MKPLSITRGALPDPRLDRDRAGLLDLAGEYSQYTVPGPVAEAIVHAARTTDLGRTNTGGGLYLTRGLVVKLQDVNDLEIDEEHIVLTGGANAALSLVFASLCDPGEEVLVPDPGSPIYRHVAAVWGVPCLGYRCALDGTPDYAALESLVGHQTKAILLCSPGNPSGSVLDAGQLQTMVDFAREHDLYVISDETYDQIRYRPGPAVGPARFDADGRVASIFSFSRTHALAGLRLGYLVAAPPLARALLRTQEALQSGPSTLALAAGLTALEMDPALLESMTAFYRQQRETAQAMLPAGTVPYVPEGSYFMLIDVSRTEFLDGAAFAATCRRDAQVNVAPGPSFGEVTRQMARLTLAVRERPFAAGVERLAQFIAAHPA